MNTTGQEQEQKSLFKAKQLLSVLSAQSASTFANQVIALVVPWLVLTRTGSAASAGTIAFVMGIAALAGTLTGGLVTDRIGGRRVSALADGLSLITALMLAATLWLDSFSLWLVAATQVLGVFFDGPGNIAKSSMVPAAAEKEGIPITRAMGSSQTLQGVATFVGPITAGLLIATVGEANTLLVTTVLFLTSIVLVARLPKQVISHDRPMTPVQVYRDLRDAVRFLIKEPFLGRMQLVGPLMGAVIVPISALIFPAWFVFGQQDSRALGTFLGAGAVGGMVGGAIFAALAQKLPQRTWLIGATGLYGVALLGLFFLQPGSIPAIMVSFVAGTMMSVMFAVPFTAFYARTPQHLLGRVGSLGAANGALFGAVASLGFGHLINNVSAPQALLTSAMIMGGIAIALAALPFVRLLDRPTETAEPAAEEATELILAGDSR
ncbi:MFS transporter [Microlunatus parietis]|uniref:Putative MFS family arabinose efflux permease n=1 Tax=Microlunatus parietis TaxID=682979 RepID=A0A7Y9I452_9ACTN|nr:MFS transporter [Microlunatus parietis]NYE69935.1 putative MFS family arabinose efflux permease [Microlunatus parietis]